MGCVGGSFLVSVYVCVCLCFRRNCGEASMQGPASSLASIYIVRGSWRDCKLENVFFGRFILLAVSIKGVGGGGGGAMGD